MAGPPRRFAGPGEAIEHFLSNDEWHYYARRYDETHGLPAETRVYD